MIAVCKREFTWHTGKDGKLLTRALMEPGVLTYGQSVSVLPGEQWYLAEYKEDNGALFVYCQKRHHTIYISRDLFDHYFNIQYPSVSRIWRALK